MLWLRIDCPKTAFATNSLVFFDGNFVLSDRIKVSFKLLQNQRLAIVLCSVYLLCMEILFSGPIYTLKEQWWKYCGEAMEEKGGDVEVITKELAHEFLRTAVDRN